MGCYGAYQSYFGDLEYASVVWSWIAIERPMMKGGRKRKPYCTGYGLPIRAMLYVSEFREDIRMIKVKCDEECS